MRLISVFSALLCGTLSFAAYGVSAQRTYTVGGICFAAKSSALSFELRKELTQIIRAQEMNLDVIVVIGYGDGTPSRASVKAENLGKLRATEVRRFLSEEMGIELNRIYVDGRSFSAWPDEWHRKFRGGNVRLPCLEDAQWPSPLMVEVIGTCGPKSLCKLLRCDRTGCEAYIQ